MDTGDRSVDPSSSQPHKKVKLSHDESTQKDHFSTLNDDCILEICNYLEPDDLFAVSEMCVRFKRLANSYFRRKYTNFHKHNHIPKWVGVSVKDDGDIVLSPEEFWGINIPVKNFVGCIPYVYISEININVSSKVYRNNIDRLVKFLQRNWNGNLMKLRFSSIGCIKSLGQNIETALSGVQELHFVYVDEENKSVNEMLKYCSMLKILRIDENFIAADDEYSKCDTLELIECQIADKHSAEKLIAFLQRNPNVSKLKCSFEGQHFPKWKPKLINVLDVTTEVSSISELYLKFETPYVTKSTGWKTIHQKLKKLDEKQHFKRLKLFFEHEYHSTEWQLLDDPLQSLSGLKLGTSATESLNNKLLTINRFAQLKMLSLYYPSENPMIYTSLTQNLLNLEKVRLCVSDIHDSYFEFVQSSKLSRLVLKFFHLEAIDVYENVRNRLGLLNERRQKVHNACKMVIYLNYASRFLASDLNNRTLPWVNKNNLVSLAELKY